MRSQKVVRPAPKTSTNTWRVNLLLFFVFALSGLIIYRLFNLTFVDHESFVATAKSQYASPTAALAGRGSIYLTDASTTTGPVKKIAAANRSATFIYSNNKQLTKSPAEIVSILAPILGEETRPFLLDKLSDPTKSYQILSSNLTKSQAVKIQALKIKGVAVSSQIDRFYTLGATASQVLGFVGYDGRERVGQYGIEAFYDSELSGKKMTQKLFGNRTYSHIWDMLAFWKKDEPPATVATSVHNGGDIILSIDRDIQEMVEAKLETVIKKWSATGGIIIVQDPKSGEILALASSPSYDPNKYYDYKLGDFINPSHQVIYEPGSSFKPITMAGAIEYGAVSPDTKYTDSGQVQIGGYTIRNFDEKAYGVQTMRKVLEKSLNTGAIFAQQKMGDDPFLNNVVAFGFGQKTGIDLAWEVGGNISNLYSGRKINFATASFGQGIAVTPIQLLNAYSAIANGGKLMWPHVARQIVKSDGSIENIVPKIINSPITEKTAKLMQSMLVDVVDKGFDKARINGYHVAGKTGTAQIPDSSGGYLDNDRFIHNFVGFAPAYDARFTILIKIDKPKGIKFAADSLSPVFGDVAGYLIRYFNIPPTR